MRTENDLRESFDRLAAGAPHPGNVRAALQDGRRAPRRTALIIGTALATATAATAAVVAPHLISSGAPVAGRPKADSAWSRWVDLNLPGNVHAVGQRFTANRQDFELFNAAQVRLSSCQLQLHRNGDFDPATIPAASPTIDIGGHPARVVTSTAKQPFMPGPLPYRYPAIASVRKTLAWQPVDGVWSLLTCETQRKPDTEIAADADLGMATGLASAFGAPARLGSPVKLGDLPDGVTAREVNYQPTEKVIGVSGDNFTVLLGDGSPATGYVPPVLEPAGLVSGEPWDPDRGDDLSIRYDTSTRWNQATQIRHGKADAVIHGMKAYYINQTITYSKKDPSKATLSGPLNTLRLEANGVAVVITSYTPNPSKDALIRIAQSLELTKQPNNPAAWFDAATAIH
jgi:hypothetical protein